MSRQKKHPEKPAEEKTQAGKGKRGRKRKGMCLEDRPILEPNAAGIDIGAREIFVAVPSDRDEHPVRVFSTFTEDLEKLAQWLVSCGITTVAMESTGVYWIPLYDVVDAYGLKACLVDARGMKKCRGGARTGTNASGCNFCIRWGCCARHFGRRAMCAPYDR